jgi:hypothetical protein
MIVSRLIRAIIVRWLFNVVLITMWSQFPICRRSNYPQIVCLFAYRRQPCVSRADLGSAIPAHFAQRHAHVRPLFESKWTHHKWLPSGSEKCEHGSLVEPQHCSSPYQRELYRRGRIPTDSSTKYSRQSSQPQQMPEQDNADDGSFINIHHSAELLKWSHR